MGLVHIKSEEQKWCVRIIIPCIVVESPKQMCLSHNSFYSPTTSCLSPDDAIERDVSVRADFNLSGDGFVSAANRARGGLIVVVCEAVKHEKNERHRL